MEFISKPQLDTSIQPKLYKSSDHDNVELISRMAGVITCEDYIKWYDLQYIDYDGVVYNLSDKFAYTPGVDMLYLDGTLYPPDILKFAKRHNIRVGDVSYFVMCVMWAWNFYNYKDGKDYIRDCDLQVDSREVYDVLAADLGEIRDEELLEMVDIFNSLDISSQTIKLHGTSTIIHSGCFK